jgi:hypothetical protein
MKYFQFNTYKQNDQLEISPIEEKEAGNTPYEITDKITIIQIYDQTKGKTLLFLSSSLPILESFLDGFQTRQKAEKLL